MNGLNFILHFLKQIMNECVINECTNLNKDVCGIISEYTSVFCKKCCKLSEDFLQEQILISLVQDFVLQIFYHYGLGCCEISMIKYGVMTNLVHLIIIIPTNKKFNIVTSFDIFFRRNTSQIQFDVDFLTPDIQANIRQKYGLKETFLSSMTHSMRVK